MTTPEGILFDLDGTLVDSERENIESVVLAVRKHGAHLSAEERQFIIGHSWNEIYEVIARNHSLPVSMTQLIAEAVAEKRSLLAIAGHRALPGALALVQRLARNGISKLAIVTGSSTAEARDSIAGVGLTDHIAVLVAAEDYPRGKPAPDPYATAIARLGVRAERTIEDATPGILSARAAGARVIAVRAGNFVGYDLSPADVIVDTLDDVTDDLMSRLLA